ncbi:MAG: DUF362 domain-containing protein [Pseudomonadota bacterium]
MDKHAVAVVKYEKPLESVRRAVELCGGLERIKAGDKVFLKPNIVFWSRQVDFPKWGVITTSRVMEDMVTLLYEHGVRDITIGEGIVVGRPDDSATANHAFESLGYNRLAQRFGVKVYDAFKRPYREVDLGEGMALSFNADILDSDFVVDLPVMKTHAQTMVSLGLKNLKGMIDIKSRKRCHSADPARDLHAWVSHLADPMPPILNLVDGIYTAELGPAFDGVMHRSNLLAASWDLLSADLVAARLLGHDPAAVPYLAQAAARQGRATDLADVEVAGERIEDHARYHAWTFPYNEEGTLPLPMAKKGMSGLAYYKYDTSLCTYCSGVNGAVIASIAMAWNGQPWDDVEVLTGKMMQPRPARKTVLLGKCMYQGHKDNPAIQEMIAVKGCPPQPEQIVAALHQAGVMIEPGLINNLERLPGMFLKRYQDKPEFDPSLFSVA